MCTVGFGTTEAWGLGDATGCGHVLTPSTTAAELRRFHPSSWLDVLKSIFEEFAKENLLSRSRNLGLLFPFPSFGRSKVFPSTLEYGRNMAADLRFNPSALGQSLLQSKNTRVFAWSAFTSIYWRFRFLAGPDPYWNLKRYMIISSSPVTLVVICGFLRQKIHSVSMYFQLNLTWIVIHGHVLKLGQSAACQP